MASLRESQWKKVPELCRGATVFLDDGAAELVHWAGDGELLKDCVGVYDLYRELSPVARDFIASAHYSSVVFIVSSFLTGSCSSRINQLLSTLQPLHCHVLTTKSQELHSDWTPMPGGGPGVSESYSHYGEFQALLRKWINRETGVRVSVSHLPVSVAEICPGVFTTPTSSALFPLLPSDLEEITARCLQEGDVNHSLDHLGHVEFDMLTHPFKMEIKSLVESLDCMLGGMDCGEELFSLGHTSRLVATQLAALPRAKVRRKTAGQKCSLLLVDRSLDLCGPATHQSDTLGDRILSALPHPSPSASDVCADLGPVVSSDNGGFVKGCLAQPGNQRAEQLLRTIICSKQKESLMEVSRCLLDSLSQEGLSVKLTGKLARPSPAQLRAFLQQFKDQASACVNQKAVIQLACAVVQGLESTAGNLWDRMASLEKDLLRSPRPLVKLAELIRAQTTPTQDELPVSCLLGLATAVFSLYGESTVKDQTELEQLKESLADVVKLWRDCDTKFLTTTFNLERGESGLRLQERLGNMFTVLEGLGECRNQLKQFQHIGGSRGQYQSLVAQLSEGVFNPSHSELSDVDFHSQGSMSNIIKSSFSLFMGSARPHPTDQPTIVLFLVGGVTSAEIKTITDTVSAHKSNIKVLVGGTRLLSQADVVDFVFSGSRTRN